MQLLSMFDEESVKNPVNEFVYSFPIEHCNNEELDWMIKNLKANFHKLYGCSVNIAQIQHDYLTLDKVKGSLDVTTFSVNSIEYFFVKVSTIFELSYQIFEELCNPVKSGSKKKHEILEEEFEEYNNKVGEALRIDWYQALNKVRNRIIHGGFSLKAYTENQRILFQAYDSGLNEQILEDYGFFREDGVLIYADFYTNFYTRVCHWYIKSFLDFILDKLGVFETDTREDKDPLSEIMKSSSSVLILGSESLFKSLALEMGEDSY